MCPPSCFGEFWKWILALVFLLVRASLIVICRCFPPTSTTSTCSSRLIAKLISRQPTWGFPFTLTLEVGCPPLWSTKARKFVFFTSTQYMSISNAHSLNHLVLSCPDVLSPPPLHKCRLRKGKNWWWLQFPRSCRSAVFMRSEVGLGWEKRFFRKRGKKQFVES